MLEYWDVWIADAGATGISFARSRVDSEVAGARVLIHAAPARFHVTVRGEDGAVVAEGSDLERTADGPMAYLLREANRITLDDAWPADSDVGRLVILPGGEAGILLSWWNADDRSEWRWRIEFYNHT